MSLNVVVFVPLTATTEGRRSQNTPVPQAGPLDAQGYDTPDACRHSVSSERVPVRHGAMFSRNQVLGQSNLILAEVGQS